MSAYTEAMTLEQRLARIEAYIDIQNLMSKYAFYHTANRHQDCAELFALNTDDVWAEMTWGRYCGRESLMRLYPQFHTWVDGDPRGKMHVHTPCRPCIEVAADCKTARGMWVASDWEYGLDKVYPPNDPEVPPRYTTWTEREWANRDNSNSAPVAPLREKEKP